MSTSAPAGFTPASPVVALFPRRPLQLQAVHVRSTWWTRICTVLGFLFIGFWTVASSYSLIDEFRLHNSGTPALKSHMENGLCHERLIYDCELDAEYITSDGSRHTRHQEYFTLFQKPNTETRFLVRYDPKAPEHISTSWGTGLLPNRTLVALLGYLILISCAAAFIGSIGSKSRLRRDLDAIGAQPTPIEATFLKAHAAPNSVKATIAYTWTDAMGLAHKGANDLVSPREPFWLDATKTRMLAVAGPNNKAYLLDSRLESVSLTPQERAQLTAARDRSLSAATQ